MNKKEIEETLMDIANELYCPKCEYLICVEKEDSEGSEVYCQNCLAWSIITVNNNTLELKFIKYDKRE